MGLPGGVSGIEQEMNQDITPEVVEALEAPAEYDGGTFYMLLMGTDKSAARGTTSTWRYLPLRLHDPHACRPAEQEGHHGVDAPRYRDRDRGLWPATVERLLRHWRLGVCHQDGFADGRRAHFPLRPDETSRLRGAPQCPGRRGSGCAHGDQRRRGRRTRGCGRADADRRRGAHSVPLAPLL